MRKSFSLLLAAVALLAALCSSAWAADDVVWDAKDSPFVVSKDVTIGERIKVSGDFTLKLEDGFTLLANKGITVKSGDALTIEGGPLGTGKLVATSTANLDAAIGGDDGNDAGKITINGGVVTANAYSGSTAAAIGGGYDGSGGVITINGGDVTAMNVQSNSFGAAIGSGLSNTKSVSGGVIKITGGVVTARAFNGAAIGGGAPETAGSDTISGGTIIMTGGIVSADSVKGDGIGYGVGAVSEDKGKLQSDANGTAWIDANKIGADMTGFQRGVAFIDKDGKVYGDMTISGDVKIPAGKTLTVPTGKSLTIPEGMSMAMQGGSKLTVEQGATLTIAADAKFDATKGTVENKGTIVNEGSLDASATGKIVNTGTIKNKGTMDAAGDTIDNKGTIENDGTVNLPEGTSAEVIKKLNMTGSGKVMAGEKEYSNDGTPTDGGGDERPTDGPVSADQVIAIDALTALPGSENIDTDHQSEPFASSADVAQDAPILEDVVVEDAASDATPYGPAVTVAADVAVDLAKSVLVESGIIAGDSDITAAAITRMPIRKNEITPGSGKTETLIMFANLRPSDLVSSDRSVRVQDIAVIKVKSADSALPVRAVVAADGSGFENGCFMITDGTRKPVSLVDPNSSGTYNLIVRVKDLADSSKIGDSDNFDINVDQYTVVDPIIVVKNDGGSGGGASSGGACTAGAAAVVGLAALAMMKRRTR